MAAFVITGIQTVSVTGCDLLTELHSQESYISAMQNKTYTSNPLNLPDQDLALPPVTACPPLPHLPPLPPVTAATMDATHTAAVVMSREGRLLDAQTI